MINEVKRMQQLAGINEMKVRNPARLYNIGDKVYVFNDIDRHTIKDIVPDIYSINKVDPYSNPNPNDYDEEDINNTWFKLENAFWYPQSVLSGNINLYNDINEIKVRRPNSIEDIKKFYNEYIGREWEEENTPDWGGIDNLIDIGPDEYNLDLFISSYNEVLSEEDIILLWLYCYSDYLNGDIEDEEELEVQIRDLGYSDDDINYFVNIIKDEAGT
jgi:hypothetical protein